MPRSKTGTNEAELEARLQEFLRNFMPTIEPLRVRHQHTFTLKFGHQQVVVDGKPKSSAKGRYDVLVFVDNRPVMMLELKRPGLGITEDDFNQGLAYARLTKEMPPIVVITDGMETKCYSTYSARELTFETVNEKQILDIVSAAAKVAAADIDSSVDVLLGGSISVLKEFSEQLNRQSFQNICGGICELNRPVVEDFQIRRNIVGRIRSSIDRGSHLIAVAGAPLVGKTNVLFQLCGILKDSGLIPLFFHSQEIGRGILEAIADAMTEHLGIPFNAEKIRQWISRWSASQNRTKIVILVDTSIDFELKEIERSIADVKRLISMGSLCVVFSVSTSKAEAMVESTAGTYLGRSAKIFELDVLDKNEFRLASDIISGNRWGLLGAGASMVPELRFPAYIRSIAARAKSTSDKDNHDDESILVVDHITTPASLMLMSSLFLRDATLMDLYARLAKAFHSESRERRTNIGLLLTSMSTCCITIDGASSVIGRSELSEFAKMGHVSIRTGYEGKVFVFPKSPEMMAAAGSRLLGELASKETSFEGAYSVSIGGSKDFPISDAVGATALGIAVVENPDWTEGIVNKLLADEPAFTTGKVRVGAVVGSGELKDFLFDVTDEDPMCGNTHPWLVLSLMLPSMIDSDGMISKRLEIASVVGDFPGLLFRINPGVINSKLVRKGLNRITTHYVKGRGTVLCDRMGIVEPITNAMVSSLATHPLEYEEFVDWAIKEDKFILASRLSMASRSMISSLDTKVKEVARRTFDRLHDYTASVLGITCGDDKSCGSD